MTVPGVYSPEQGAKQRRRHAMVRQARIVAVMAAITGIGLIAGWAVMTWPRELLSVIWVGFMIYAVYRLAALFVDQRS